MSIVNYVNHKEEKCVLANVNRSSGIRYQKGG